MSFLTTSFNARPEEKRGTQAKAASVFVAVRRLIEQRDWFSRRTARKAKLFHEEYSFYLWPGIGDNFSCWLSQVGVEPLVSSLLVE